MKPSYWKGKKVLVAPARSALGTWTILLLNKLGAEVTALAEPNSPGFLFDSLNLGEASSLFYAPFNDPRTWQQVLQSSQAEIVFYLESEEPHSAVDLVDGEVIAKQVAEGSSFFEAFRQSEAHSCVLLSTDRVYEKNPDVESLDENSRLAPEDFLATGYLCREFVAQAYQQKYFRPEKFKKHQKNLSVVRMVRGFGPGDVFDGSLLADCARVISAQQRCFVQKPGSLRPWIHYLDQAHGLILTAENLANRGPKASRAFNLGGAGAESVEIILREFVREWGPEAEACSSFRRVCLSGGIGSSAKKGRVRKWHGPCGFL